MITTINNFLKKIFQKEYKVIENITIMPFELDEIKKLRKKLNLTQTQLAKKANVSQSLIAKNRIQ